MRSLFAAMAALCLFPVGLAQAYGPNGGPDSIYTGEGGRYVSASEFASSPRRHARPRVRSHRQARAARHRAPHAARAEGVVYARGGVTAKVNPKYRARFQCLVDALEANGYRISFMGGYRNSKIAGTDVVSKHAFGNALDVNQTARNRVKGALPKNASALAKQCGLFHGAQWGDPDAGHFEVPGEDGFRSQLEDADKQLAEEREHEAEPVQLSSAAAEFVPLGPLKVTKPAPLRESDKAKIFERDADYNYLCTVYNREPQKIDSSGDFTVKDIKAAAKRGLGLCEFAIGGMHPQFRHAVAETGRAIDRALPAIRWTILSAFRDDYRQSIAEGFKARVGYSLHGGSRVTRGYGDGRAIDVTIAGDRKDGPARAGALFAKYGKKFGLVQPMPVKDVAHIQASGSSSYAQHRKPRHGKHTRYAAR